MKKILLGLTAVFALTVAVPAVAVAKKKAAEDKTEKKDDAKAEKKEDAKK